MSVDFAGAQPGSVAYYARVDYETLKRRSKQVYAYRGPWEWEFAASLVCRESGFTYRSCSSAGACGLFQMKKATAEFMGGNYSDMKRSVPLQLRLGKKYLAFLRGVLNDNAPELVQRGGDDLYAITYYAFNQGHGAARTVIKKLKAQGKAVTWENFKPLIRASHAAVADQVLALIPQFRDRYAELVLGETTRVATYSSGSEGALEALSAELEHELTQRAAEDDGEDVPIPPALDDYGPEPLPDGSAVSEQTHAGSPWALRALVGVTAAAVLAGGTYVLIQRSRGKRAFA